MTVSSTTNKVIYTCNGSTTEFAFTFKVFATSDLEVILYTIADGTETTLTETTDYTVSLTDDGDSGGTVTTVETYSSSYKLIIRRTLSLTQATDYVENDEFPAESHEDALDKVTMIAQQLDEKIDRAVLQDSTGSGVSSFPTAEANKVIGWNSDGDALENKTVNDSAYISIASQAEAEAGTDNTDVMTPLRTAQAIAASALVYPTKVTLTIAGSPAAVATDASLGTVFRIAATESFTLSNPTNPTDGQKVVWQIEQDGTGSRVIALGSAFRVSNDIDSGSITLSTAANTTDYIGAIYNGTDSKWDVIAFAKNVEGN